jgi:hypothetical protein
VCHTQSVKVQHSLLAARLYVLAFVICLVAPGALLTIVMPRLMFSNHWPPSPTLLAATLMMWLALGAACLIAALGITSRLVRWLAAMVLSVGVLRYGYVHLFAARDWSEALLFITMLFPFLGGPMCVGIWLCFRRFPAQARLARNRSESRPSA